MRLRTARTSVHRVNSTHSEQPASPFRVAQGLLVLLSAVFAAALGDAVAQGPPQPDFYWPYGTVSIEGENIEPAVQPVLAIVNGRVCGSGATTIANAGPDVPPTDVGRTVYVLDVLADGTNAGQAPGCGTPGDLVTLYFPESQRVAFERPLFRQGPERVDLNLGPILTSRLQTPMLAADALP